jgi:hypothetical protein
MGSAAMIDITSGEFKVVEYFWRDHSEFIDTRSDIVTHSGPDFWSPPLVSQPDQYSSVFRRSAYFSS